MDAVKSFNAELSALYEVKPPISKAKMTSITRGAIKAIKFYKHVVQSVEKFILKCKPEYKVPGLYVIDSIVRQSRHQFGAERDVFAPRFAKNMQQTFINLFKCPPEDKSKVIRVLNLWQKNQVFAPDVIQPLFDLADPNHPIHRELIVPSNGLPILHKGSPAVQKSPAKGPSQGPHQVADPALAHLTGVANNPGALHDPTTLAQLQQLQKLLQWQAESGRTADGQSVKFDRKLLDYDYGDDEDEDRVNPSPKQIPGQSDPFQSVGRFVPAVRSDSDLGPSLLSNPEVLRQLQTLQQTMAQAQHQELDLEKLRKLQEMKQQEEEFDKHLAQTVPNLPFASECELKPIINTSPMPNYYMSSAHDLTIPPPGYKMFETPAAIASIPPPPIEPILDPEVEFIGGTDISDVEVINLDHSNSRSISPREDRYARRRRTRSRSRDRGGGIGGRRRRTRSRSRSRDRRSRRSRDRSRDREKDKDKEKDREKEKERKKRGLPPIKKDHLSVCSTTLWVGHLSKLVHQEELSDTFGEFGDVVSIDLISPRGCAFIVMNRRQDAARCLLKLKNHKLQGKAITVAWAPGKGVKGKEFKDYWETDLGCSYIPWIKIKSETNFELLEDGGMLDEDTMPVWLKSKLTQPKMLTQTLIDMEGTPTFVQVATSSVSAIDTSQPPPLPLQPQLPPLSIVTPFQLNNRLMQPVGMNLPGMMVPPPNIPLPNQLMVGSPFNQPQVVAPQPAIVTIHDENMDVEMEDADKEKPALSDQLLASLNRSGGDTSFGAAVSRLHAVAGKLELNRRDDDTERNDRRERDDRYRDSKRSGGGRERDRRNRWSDRRDRSDERREREKSLNDRLRDLADGYAPRDRSEKEMRFEPVLLEAPPPPPVPRRFDYPDLPAQEVGEVDRFIPPKRMHRADEWEEPEQFPDDLPPPSIQEGDFPDDYERERDFDQPPHFVDDAEFESGEFDSHNRYDDERFMRPGRGGGFDRRGPPMQFDMPLRGPRPGGFGPPAKMRGNFWRPPLLMRGGPRPIPPRMMGGPGPMFHPRGGPMIRPRPPGPWMEGGMRPNFPRFSKGPPGPPGIFDDPPHVRNRRREDRWHHRNERNDFPNEGFNPRQRWGPPGPFQDDAEVVVVDDAQRQNDQPDINEGGENGSGEGGGATPLHDEPREELGVGGAVGGDEGAEPNVDSCDDVITIETS